jgi:hypothetical protein
MLTSDTIWEWRNWQTQQPRSRLIGSKFPVFTLFFLGGVFGSFGPWMGYTNVASKLFVTLGFVFLLHFSKRSTSGRTARLELPVTSEQRKP